MLLLQVEIEILVDIFVRGLPLMVELKHEDRLSIISIPEEISNAVDPTNLPTSIRSVLV